MKRKEMDKKVFGPLTCLFQYPKQKSYYIHQKDHHKKKGLFPPVQENTTTTDAGPSIGNHVKGKKRNSARQSGCVQL